MSLYFHSSRWKSFVVGIAAIEPKWQHTDSVRSYRLKRVLEPVHDGDYRQETRLLTKTTLEKW